MLKEIVSSPHVNLMQDALNASSLRQQVISNNIANVNTPGFKKSEVNFEDQLQAAIDSESKGNVLARTHERHLPAQSAAVKPQINKLTNTTLRLDGNNVDIDEEMAQLAKNNIYYDAMAQSAQHYFSVLKSCIAGGK